MTEFPILSFVIFILGYFFFLYRIKSFGKTLILYIDRKLVLPDKIQPYERDFLGGKIT